MMSFSSLEEMSKRSIEVRYGLLKVMKIHYLGGEDPLLGLRVQPLADALHRLLHLGQILQDFGAQFCIFQHKLKGKYKIELYIVLIVFWRGLLMLYSI